MPANRLRETRFFRQVLMLPAFLAVLIGVSLSSTTPGWSEDRIDLSEAVNTPEAPVAIHQASGPDNEYILATGDGVTVEDANMGLLTPQKISISADGTLDLPLIGIVELAGLSLDKAQALLNEKYKAYYVNPAISLQLLGQHPIRVYIQGAVHLPGIYVSGKNTQTQGTSKYSLGAYGTNLSFNRFYLTDALIQAGGVQHNADLQHIKIYRSVPQQQIIHINLWELLKSGAIIQDIPLQEQDVVEIPALPKEMLVDNTDWKILSQSNLSRNVFNVNVIGAVNKPGTYQISSQDNILTAIAEAGGFSELASQDNMFVLRTNSAGQVFKKQVKASDGRLTGKGKSDWVALLPDDVIFVDEATSKKALNAGKSLFDKASNASAFSFFNQLLRED